MRDSIFSTDNYLEIAAERIQRFEAWHVFGRNPDVDTGTDPEDVWNGASVSVIQTMMTVPAPLLISSSAAANDDDQTIVVDGIDDNWDRQTVTTTPNNQTAVILGQGNRIDTYMISLAALVAGPPAGTVITQASSGASMSVVGSDTTHNTIWGYASGTFDLAGALTDPSGTMNPAAPVPTAYTACSFWLRVNVSYNTSANALNGDLYVAEQDTLAAGVPTTAARVHDKIDIGMEQSHNSYFSVPRNHKAYILKGYMTMNSGNQGGAIMNFMVREYGGVWRSQYIFGVDESASSAYVYDFSIPQVAPAQSDIKIQAVEVVKDNTDISAGYELILEDLR